ncbi:MAG: NAD(P)/FAD-dependent oxidoreductase [Phenylobacterium sp.]
MRNDGHPEGSWYAETAALRLPDLPPPEGDVRTGVCVVGAGFTGLGAALALARAGVPVVVLEQAKVGSGASGRNGGQAHPGHRQDQAWLEARVGRDEALRLWKLAETARAHLAGLLADAAPESDYRPGLILARHRPGGERGDAAHVEHMARVYGCEALSLVSREALAEDLGTPVYHGGVLDRDGGHLHPLNLALGLARAVLAAGGRICEGAPALSWTRRGGGIEVTTPTGRILCDRLILTGDGYLTAIAGAARDRVMPINNFVLVTEPLGARADRILRSGAAAADTRFVVNYFRKTDDGRLLFGGGETYRQTYPADLAGYVRRSLLKIYPDLADVRITHAWGGSVGVTLHRTPLVSAPAPGVTLAAGYSGQGVMLAPYVGHLLGLEAAGDEAAAEALQSLRRLPAPTFPGGRWLRRPLTIAGLTWYALRDRL